MKTAIRSAVIRKLPSRSRFTTDPAFREHLSGCNLRWLGASRDTVYVLDRRFRLRGYNETYRRLGMAEGGKGWMRRHGLGFPVFEGFSGFYADHYRRTYLRCLETGESHGALHGGATPVDYRWYRETVRPLGRRAGLLITHHLLQTIPVADAARYDPEEHRSADGLVLKCCHCSRVRNCRKPGYWEWLPGLETQVDEELSHGLCPRCLNTYYREFLPPGR